jgi:hypothetical protein
MGGRRGRRGPRRPGVRPRLRHRPGRRRAAGWATGSGSDHRHRRSPALHRPHRPTAADNRDRRGRPHPTHARRPGPLVVPRRAHRHAPPARQPRRLPGPQRSLIGAAGWCRPCSGASPRGCDATWKSCSGCSASSSAAPPTVSLRSCASRCGCGRSSRLLGGSPLPWGVPVGPWGVRVAGPVQAGSVVAPGVMSPCS